MDPLAEILGASAGIVALREKLWRLLRASDARRLPPILLEGETGTGKGLLARVMHRASARRDGPFVDVNCAAIPETLLEAEMFGFERGAFTDARHSKPGLLQLAHRGTIFLDEVALLPETLQAKLLKVLEERAVRRLGGTRPEPVDMWILTATNQDLAAATRERRFREDLYHRLAVVVLTLPALRERAEDVIPLAEHFLARACADYGVAPRTLDAGARAALRAYPWPGNVRELANAMERVVLLADAPGITAEALALSPVTVAAAPSPARSAGVPLEEAIRDVERQHLLQALREANWNISRAASRLGISRNTVRYRMERHGLRREGPEAPAKHQEPAAGEPRSIPSPASPSSAADPAVTSPVPSIVRWERRRIAFLHAALAGPAVPLEGGRALELLVAKVQNFGGRVEELGAVAIVAAFGLEPVEDSPRRAANAAMAIQKAAERARAETPGAPRVWAAIHVAEVLVGRVNGGAVIDQEARQEVWRVLEELGARAGPGVIALSHGAASFLRRRFELVPVDDAVPPVLRLAGPERAVLTPAGSVSTFVGRQHDLQLLRGLLESAERGQGQVAGITGEAGIGKSRLLLELRQRLAGRPAGYVEGHCLSYGGTTPYLPLIDILRAACDLGDRDGPAAVADRVRAVLLEVGMEPAEAAPYLLRLLGFRGDAEAISVQNPEAIKTRTFERLRELLVRRSRQAPLIVVVEDLHWVDPTSEEFLATLVEAVAGTGILLVVSYRSGYRPSWLDRSYATQIALQPLAPAEARTVLRSVLGEGRVDEALVARILVKAEGNPFFLEELARTVREQGGSMPTLDVPDTVEDVVLARIDRLPPEDKRLLQTAAVVGKDVSLGVLEAVTDLPAAALAPGLRRLTAGEFLYDTSAGPERQFTFNHALTHEVVYSSLLPEQRRDLHGRIVEALEHRYAERSEHAETLAHHAVRGEVWERAVDYLREAGAHAFTKGSVEETLAWYEQALALTARLPAGADNLRRAIDVRLDLHVPLIVLGQVSRLHKLHEDSELLAHQLDDRLRLGRVLYRIGQYSWMDGRYHDALRFAEQAQDIALAIGDPELRVLSTYVLAVTLHSLGEYPAAVEQFVQVVDGRDAELAKRLLAVTVPAYVGACAWLAHCLTLTGDLERALTYSVRAMQAAEAADHPQAQVIAATLRAIPLVYRGETANAVALAEGALALCMSKSLLVWLPAAASTYGWALAVSGRAEDGLPHLERGATILEGLGVKTHVARLYTWWAEGLLMAGRLADARRAAERAVELAVACGERAHAAEAHHVLARLDAADASAAAGAAARFAQVMGEAEKLGMRPLIARCHLGLGQLHQRAGRRDQARTELRRALALLSEIGLQAWRADATTALGEADPSWDGR